MDQRCVWLRYCVLCFLITAYRCTQRSHTPVLHGMMKVIPYLTFGHAESMCELIDHFVPHLNFDV